MIPVRAPDQDEDVSAHVLETIPSTDVMDEEFVQRNPSILEVDTTPAYSMHSQLRGLYPCRGHGHVEAGG